MFKLGFSVPSLRTRIPSGRSHPYRKDRWRLHYFCGHPSRAGNSYDRLALFRYVLSFILIRIFNLFVMFICICFIAPLLRFIYDIFLLCFSTHTHVHLHGISSILELHPFRRKCWLRSREIIISAIASQTLPEFMMLIIS